MARKKNRHSLNPNGVHLFAQYVKRAKRKGLTFRLTKQKFFALTQADCYICGAAPAQKYIHSYKRLTLLRTPFIYNGIDRIDNSKGYIAGNVHACCGTCNHAKKEHSLVDFLQYLLRCYKFTIEPYLPKDADAYPGEETSRPSEDALAELMARDS